MRPFIVLALALAVGACTAAACAPKPGVAPGAYVARLRREAAALRPLAASPLAQRFLDAASTLPEIAPRTLDRKGKTVTIDEEAYYEADVSHPLHYVRPLGLLGDLGLGSRVLDFGYGSIGHLRMLASLGLDVTGIEVKPELLAMYGRPGDTGAFGSGRLRLLDGFFPTDARLAREVGGGYDVVVAKNTLKKGYIHPDRPAPEKWLIRLGVDDGTFLAAFHDALAPRGRMLLYNIFVPIPAEQPFKPMSDGRSPFAREQWEAAGFVVEAFDEDDSPSIRRVLALTGDGGPPSDFHALYTLVRRP